MMRPAEAKKILQCSYTTLHNYVKTGKLKLIQTTSKQHNYDDQSVYQLANSLHNNTNRLSLFLNGNTIILELTPDIFSRIISCLQHELTPR